MHRILNSLLRERIVVLDGATGTMLQERGLDEADYRGERFRDSTRPLRGNHDLLCLTRPDVVAEVHDAYLGAGCDVVLTNTFTATSIAQADYDTADLAAEINEAGARIARARAAAWSEPDRPRFAAGVLGPTNRTASISPKVEDPSARNTSFDELRAAYEEAARALVAGGVDLLLVETVFDTLNAKAAIFALESAFEALGRRLPVIVSGTVTDASGRILSGQTVEAFWNSIRHAAPLAAGLNCALGPFEIRPWIEEPRAGRRGPRERAPERRPPERARRLRPDPGRARPRGRRLGGARPRQHRRRVLRNDPRPHPGPRRGGGGRRPAGSPRAPPITRLAGLEPLNIAPDSLFVNVGERTNVTGSPRFARLVRDGDLETALGVARSQVENGAQVVDVNMDEGLLDSEACMVRFLNLVASEPDIARVPVMIDSSRWEVIEAGLKCVQGKGIVNSISLKNGPAEFLEQARLARRYGAAVVVMAFDEDGQADTLERRIAVCERAYELLVREAGFPPRTSSSTPTSSRWRRASRSTVPTAADFIKATRLVKERLPGALVSGGLSNVSYAFRGNNPVREAMHAAFLYHAIQAGLDMAIVNAGQLTVFDEVEPELRERVEDVILDRRPDAGERLLAIAERYAGEGRAERDEGGGEVAHLAGREADRARPRRGGRGPHRGGHRGSEARGGPPPRRHRGPPDGGHERGRRSLRRGPDVPPPGGQVRPGDEAGGRVPHPWLEAEAPAGEGSGTSPEERSGGFSGRAGRIVLATAKGDVHDIGKNIVGVVLQCNGFEVIDLGVMVPAERILSVGARGIAATSSGSRGSSPPRSTRWCTSRRR